MSGSDSTFILVATYPDEATAQEDYQVVKDAHAAGLVGSYDAAVVTKDASGKVHENKDETSTRHGAWWGVAAGAAIGVIFPPAVLGAAAVGGVVGGVSGHLSGGMSRSDAEAAGGLHRPGPGRACCCRREQGRGRDQERGDQGGEADSPGA